ncbi:MULTISPECIES: GlxA family transcriptional regulator [unclassified Nocardiopsis]|uniref:GlxA family transcriptional regulator n=1 Tax=unclassified Nocardiopsis TaxID=2649073 RepID=UPI00135CABB1|nr:MULTISPECIES: helix-turn-helix domain-containing protein [unclassified Nocardiopsis]
MRTVAVLALDGVVGFELAIPGQVFGTANTVAETPVYDVRVCAPRGGVETDPVFGRTELRTGWGLDALASADVIVVPGNTRFLEEPPPEVTEALRRAVTAGAVVASVCVGAFVVAATGALDGLRATTHWQYADELASRHPRVEVDPSVLYVDNGRILTSAGVASGLDLCLHLVRRELGAEIAAGTARRTVMPLERSGGQAQFIEHPVPAAPTPSLRHTLEWMASNLQHPLTLEDIADRAALSVRSLNRHFRSQVGTTPMRWLLRARVNRARQLLESTDQPIDRVAAEAGFGSTATFRHHFTRLTGVPPGAYRDTFARGGQE